MTILPQNPDNYCRDPQCPEGCEEGRGICTKPNVCHCRAGYYGHACQVKYNLRKWFVVLLHQKTFVSAELCSIARVPPRDLQQVVRVQL